MNPTQIRRTFIYIVLALYVLYGLGSIGMTGLLFSAAIGLICLSFNLHVELVIAAIVLSGLLFGYYMRRREGFEDKGVPLAGGSNLSGIMKRTASTASTASTAKGRAEPRGVLSSSFAEGFADANTTDAAAQPGAKKEEHKEEKKPVTSNSTPASTDAPAATEQLKKDLPTTSGFSDKLTDGMFKLGSIPADSVGGSHIDIGTTMMNALNALKPDQIKAMTEDTRKLLETQKSLMGMLQSVKPMLQDGKELMGTFNEMFGSMPKATAAPA